jgi:hypothetical protein
MIGIVDLDDGPALKASVSQAYQGEAIPSEIQNFMEAGTTCPKCGLKFCPPKECIFLVPIPDGSSLTF